MLFRSVEQEETAESTGSSEPSDADEGDALGGADPSAGAASSSRNAPPEVDIQVLSSSSGENPFRVAPSRRTTEEEESDGEEGCCEPRTKAFHDRNAGAREGASHEEGASAPQERVAANTPQPRQVPKRQWSSADQ